MDVGDVVLLSFVFEKVLNLERELRKKVFLGEFEPSLVGFGLADFGRFDGPSIDEGVPTLPLDLSEEGVRSRLFEEYWRGCTGTSLATVAGLNGSMLSRLEDWGDEFSL